MNLPWNLKVLFTENITRIHSKSTAFLFKIHISLFRFFPSNANYPCRYLATNAQVNAPKPNELNPMITWDSNGTSERNNSEIILSLLQFFVTKIFDSLIILYYNYLSFFCAIILVIFSMAQKTLQHPKPLECTQQNSITLRAWSFLQTHDNKNLLSPHRA